MCLRLSSTPRIFASLKEDQTTYILVKVAPGAKVEDVRRGILAQLRDVDVYTTTEFSHMTRFYWMFSTGAGVALLLAAVLGLIVGFVVVAQTIYATTMDHLREFGTLKAMGAPNSYVYKVIMKQAAISAVIGYGLGMIVSVFVIRASQEGGAEILMPVADGRRDIFSDAGHVRRRGAGFHSQGDEDRSGDGVQGVGHGRRGRWIPHFAGMTKVVFFGTNFL